MTLKVDPAPPQNLANVTITATSPTANVNSVTLVARGTGLNLSSTVDRGIDQQPPVAQVQGQVNASQNDNVLNITAVYRVDPGCPVIKPDTASYTIPVPVAGPSDPGTNPDPNDPTGGGTVAGGGTDPDPGGGTPDPGGWAPDPNPYPSPDPAPDPSPDPSSGGWTPDPAPDPAPDPSSDPSGDTTG